VAAIALGCHPRPAPPPPAPAAPPLSEESIAPSTSAEFEIGPIKQTVGEHDTLLFIEGTVRNVGTRPSRDVKVWVEGLDDASNVVAREETLPDPQEIPPGTVGRYLVKLPNDPKIKTFHVEAIGR
jgi:hypothetical protein